MHVQKKRRWRGLALAPLAALFVSALAGNARAENMTAKFIRIDPEPSTDEKKGTPVVNMIVELAVAHPITSFAEGCNIGGTGKKGTRDAYSCMSGKIEATGYVKQFEFPKDQAHVVSIVGGEPRPMEIVDANPVKDVEAANAGVAWEILMDASSSIGTRWASMQDVADSIIKAMGPHDAVQVKIMDDKGVRVKTKWLAAGNKGKASSTLRGVTTTYKSTASVDSLISRVEKETIDGFQSIFKDGVEGADEGVMPLIQAVVILSDGGDSSAAGFAGGAEAKVAHEKLVKGEMGIGDIKLPIPVISIWFPNDDWTGLLNETRRSNEYEWMSNMATPEVGGYFDIVLAGETKGAKIAKVVRNRFDNMYFVEAKASCLDTSGEQKFKLVFEDTKSKIVPDTWSNVPIAFNFTKWLLDVDKKKTEEAATKAPLKPGDTFEVFGDFCWGSNTGAAEAYFVTEADAADVKKASADKTGKAAKALLQNLAAKGQKAETVSASPLEAKFKVPSTPALFDNKPDSFSLNVVILDTKALRASARDQSGLLVLKAQKAPINRLLIVGAIGGGVVLILLIAILARSGGGGGGRAKRRAGGAPPAPGPTPGQPPGPPPGYAPGGSTPSGPSFGPGPAYAQPPATAFAPPATALAGQSPPFAGQLPPNAGQLPPHAGQLPPHAGQSPQTAFAPPATAFAPPATAFAPPQQQPPATAFAPPQPIPQGTPRVGSFEPGAAVATMMPENRPPPGKGLHELQKGATSFPTTCPNPACRRQVLVPPGGTAQCAFCGTLVDSAGAAAAPLPAPANFGLTGAASESAAAMAVAAASPATNHANKNVGGGTVALQSPGAQMSELRAVSLAGQTGTFRVLAGIESRAGRDGSLCSIHLNDPRCSGVHATLKVEGGALLVRDDKSHNGTYVNGNRIPPGTWTPVPGGSQLRFGPIEFTVRHES
jgi:hypothetical protein